MTTSFDPEVIISTLYSGNLPNEAILLDLCDQVRDLFLAEGNLLTLSSPITLCGDVHGQFWDVLELFRQGGQCPQEQYLFLGDYVDRGHHSVETIALLFALKVRWPDRLHLTRGNHETREITQIYGFYDEVLQKFSGSPLVWRACCAVFDFLPLAAVIDGKVMAVHGGLSPSLKSLDDLRLLPARDEDVMLPGLMTDLLWSDPDEGIKDWSMSPRGAGFLFGQDPTAAFLHSNQLQYIARAHQLVMEGYRWMFDKQIVTIWSAPNYCYRCGNQAAIMRISSDKNEVKLIAENETNDGLDETENNQASILANTVSIADQSGLKEEFIVYSSALSSVESGEAILEKAIGNIKSPMASLWPNRSTPMSYFL